MSNGFKKTPPVRRGRFFVSAFWWRQIGVAVNRNDLIQGIFQGYNGVLILCALAYVCQRHGGRLRKRFLPNEGES